MANDTESEMYSTPERAQAAAMHTEGKQRDPNRRPLVVRKEMFFRIQETQRLANAQPNFPNIDLSLLGTAALKVVFSLQNPDQLIIKQALQDLAAVTEDLKGVGHSS